MSLFVSFEGVMLIEKVFFSFRKKKKGKKIKKKMRGRLNFAKSTARIEFDFKDCPTYQDKIQAVKDELAKPFNTYQKFISIVDYFVPNIPESTFKQNLKSDYFDFEDFDIIICDDIGTVNMDTLFQNPTVDLQELQDVLPKVLPKQIFSKIQDTYPLPPAQLLAEFDESVRASFSALATLIRSNNGNDSFLLWLAHNLIPVGFTWTDKPSERNDLIQSAGIFEKYKKAVKSHEQFWAILSPQNDFKLYDMNGQTILHFQCERVEQSHSGHSIKIWKADNDLGVRLVKIYDELVQNWVKKDIPPAVFFPYTATVGDKKFTPPEIISAFKEIILSQDTIALRAMLNHEVFPLSKDKASPAQLLIEKLFTIFASQGLVHRYISTVVSTEFTHPEQESMVLRSNSHLTYLFKFFTVKYGLNYFRTIVMPLIKEVIEKGDIGYKVTDKTSEEDRQQALAKIRTLLNNGIDKVLTSLPYVPSQFRHLASILRSMTAITLRTKHSVFNALSSFFFLRYFTPAIVTPTSVDPSYEFDWPSGKNCLSTTLVPYSQLIQAIFNMQPISIEKFPHLTKLNDEAATRYHELYNFLMALSEYDKPTAEYEKPSDDDANKAVEWLIQQIASEPQRRKAFIHRIIDLSEKEDEKTSVSFMLAQILAQCFVD